MRLQVSENKRFLVYEDGRPFFFLGDTAWELFHRLNREEAELYLRHRAENGFNVIQAVILAEMDGLKVPNPYGHTPLHDNDPARPNEEYFQHVDWIIDKAESLGLFVGLLPTWGDKWNHNTRFDYAGPEIFTPENARIYGEWLAHRYGDKADHLGSGRRPTGAERRASRYHQRDGRGHKKWRRRSQSHYVPPARRANFVAGFSRAEWLDFNMLHRDMAGPICPTTT
jgi:hypothetical protein